MWQAAPSPRSNNHGRGQPQENVLLRRIGHQRQCYNCVKNGHLANVCPSKYKVATKTVKMEEINARDEFVFYQKIHGLSCLDHAKLTDNVHTMTTGCITILFGFFPGTMWMLPPLLKAKHRD